MTNIDLEKIFESDDFKTCEDELKKSEIRSYRNSDPEPEIKVNREKMNKLKEERDFTQFNFPKIDKYKELPNANNWEKFIAKYKLNKNKYKNFFSENSEKLLNVLNDFYKHHPFLTPFVGKKYGTVLNQEIKVLYVLESHYLPTFSKVYKGYDKGYDDDKNNKQEWLWKHWYASDWAEQISLYREDLEYMWTESVIKYNMLNNGHFINMFKRMLLPLYDTIKNNNVIDNPAKGIERINNDDIKTIIEGIAFMNYYLRPAEDTGSHINPEEIDNFFSFFNLLLVWESLGKPYVVICSSRAANAFESYAQYLPQKEIDDKFVLNDKFVRCNHPSALSWFKEIKKDNTNVWFNSKIGKRTSYEIQKEFYRFQINKNQ